MIRIVNKEKLNDFVERHEYVLVACGASCAVFGAFIFGVCVIVFLDALI